MIFIVSRVVGSADGRKRPTLQVTARRYNYQPALEEGVVPPLVANRYAHLDKAGDSSVIVPGQHGYENLARYLPDDDQIAGKLAECVVVEFKRLTTRFDTSHATRLWGKTVQILVDQH